MKCKLLILSFSLWSTAAFTQDTGKVISVAKGWSNTSVNTVVFRKNSLVTYKDTQFIAYYNPEQSLVLGKRRSGETKWILQQTIYKGNALDAHNSISMMVDGKGYLHLSWDQHNVPLNYCRSILPGSLILTDKTNMTGMNETSVTYPEFYKMPSGDLIFLYRDGESGKGNLVINRYGLRANRWTQVHPSLIDGEGKRNAYWQAFVDGGGTIHISWVWRESPDVASNHDMCYAKSTDGGTTWTNSKGEKYSLPITEATAEYAWRIPERSELINQTSMYVDGNGAIYIASYWKEKTDAAPQYHVLYTRSGAWKNMTLGFRNTDFSLSGTGTKRIPISRPQLIAWDEGNTKSIGLIFRDAERGDRASMAVCADIENPVWKIIDLSSVGLGAWEPSFDTELWNSKKVLNLFVQHTERVDGEGRGKGVDEEVGVLEWRPNMK